MQTYGQLNLSVDPNLYKKFLLMASNHIFHLRLKSLNQIKEWNLMQVARNNRTISKNIYCSSFNFEIKNDSS